MNRPRTPVVIAGVQIGETVLGVGALADVALGFHRADWRAANLLLAKRHVGSVEIGGAGSTGDGVDRAELVAVEVGKPIRARVLGRYSSSAAARARVRSSALSFFLSLQPIGQQRRQRPTLGDIVCQ